MFKELDKLNVLVEELQKEKTYTSLIFSFYLQKFNTHLRQFYIKQLLTNLDIKPLDTDPLFFQHINENALPRLRIEFTKLKILQEMRTEVRKKIEEKAIEEAIEIQVEKMIQIMIHNLK